MAQQAGFENIADPAAQLNAFRDIPLGLMVWRLGDPGDVSSLRLLTVNAAAERELGWPLRDFIGQEIGESFPSLLKTNFPDCCRRVIETGKAEKAGAVRFASARVRDGVFWFDCFPLPGNCVGTAFEKITDRTKNEEAKSGALQLLHRITVAINDSTNVADAAQVCLREVCQHIGWPVGHLFVVDVGSAMDGTAKPIWHVSDLHRFRAFREASERFERDRRNKFLLEYRIRQAKRAGLTRSLGFAVLEGGALRAILEFSSDTSAPLEETLVSVISDIGVQLGRVFERQSAAIVTRRMQKQDEERRIATRRLRACTGRYAPSLKATLEQLRGRKLRHSAKSTRQMVDSLELMQRCLTEMREIGSPPIEFRSDPRY
jgi:PAS domain